MLDLSKLESGKLSNLNLKSSADVIPYLRYLVESFHSFGETKGVELLYIFCPQIEYPWIMDYDPERLMDVVSNLLSNAIKFTPRKEER